MRLTVRHIGHTTATSIAKEALATGRKVAEPVLEKGLLPPGKPTGSLRPEVVAGSRTPLA
ncbi:aspartate ammonia-lyase [Streptomyces sp. MUM 16J]|uniref:aspartate ammonia-lyase n=1 Tax=Streptomyces sp. MUM 16J TaxID=2791988 RepID=UPI0035AC2067|nr:aspartate ammonia-lyase [Streptomyces sp. MUM 16J]